MTEALKYLDDIIPYIAASLLPYAVIRYIVYSAFTKRRFRTSFAHEAALFLLCSSLIAAAALTVLPEFLQFSVSKPEVLTYNLRPFMIFVNSRNHILLNGNYSYFYINFFGNILLLFPASFIFSLCFRGNGFARVTAAGLCLSLVIEILQYSLGRCSDIDDLMLNTVGTMLGFAVYRLVARAFPAFVEWCRVRYIVKPEP